MIYGNELYGKSNIAFNKEKTAVVYAHVSNKKLMKMTNPLDRL